MSEKIIYSIETSGLPSETRVAGFEGKESISEIYRYEVYLLVRSEASLDLELESALMQPASLHIHREDGSIRKSIHGIIASLQLLDEEPGGNALYRAEIVPSFWKLTLSRHSRVWVDKSIVDVIQEVFKTAGLSSEHFELKLQGSYNPHLHICQYRESDFAFLSRWFEREGIYYSFDHSSGKDKITLWDTVANQPDAAESTVRYIPEGQTAASGVEGFRMFHERNSYSIKEVTLVDHNPLKSETKLKNNTTVDAASTASLIRHMEDNFDADGAGKRLSSLRGEHFECLRKVFVGVGVTVGLSPAEKFTLEEHPRSLFNQEYQTVAVHIRAQAASGGESLRQWVHWFGDRTTWVQVTAISSSVQYRPALKTPRPTVTGHEVGHIDGPTESNYAQIDDHSRYRVRMKFDENQKQDGSWSTWIRMIQPHAGNPEGMHFPLRKGTEVAVVFIAGDPDRPVIAAALPDTERRSPVVQANQSQNVIQTGGEKQD